MFQQNLIADQREDQECEALKSIQENEIEENKCDNLEIRSEPSKVKNTTSNTIPTDLPKLEND